MTLVLQAGFVLALALSWVGVVVLAVGLWREHHRGPAGREWHALVAGRAALLFAGVLIVTGTLTGGVASEVVGDVLLYAAVFGMASGTLTWFVEGEVVRLRPRLGRALAGLAWFLPVSAGLLAGVVGTPQACGG